jgi:SNF2 family DNA or RNA helicase
MVEMVLRRLGIRSVSITAAKSQDERNDAVLEFTTPENPCQVMNTTYNCGGTGLNLHGCCSIVILLEPAPNFNLETQAIGRVHRIGQTRPQKAYRVFQDHTINRAITGNNFRKMLPQLAAQYPDLFDQELEARVAELEAKGKGKLGDHKRAELLNNICEDSVRQLAGVADDFPWMDDLLEKKNLGLEPGVDGKMATSTRPSFMDRLKNPPAPTERPEKPEKAKTSPGKRKSPANKSTRPEKQAKSDE